MTHLSPLLLEISMLIHQTGMNTIKRHKKRNKVDALASYYGLQQIINEPTHILAESLSCIDLLFTSDQDLEMESGVHPSFH